MKHYIASNMFTSKVYQVEIERETEKSIAFRVKRYYAGSNKDVITGLIRKDRLDGLQCDTLGIWFREVEIK